MKYKSYIQFIKWLPEESCKLTRIRLVFLRAINCIKERAFNIDMNVSCICSICMLEAGCVFTHSMHPLPIVHGSLSLPYATHRTVDLNYNNMSSKLECTPMVPTCCYLMGDWGRWFSFIACTPHQVGSVILNCVVIMQYQYLFVCSGH